MTAFTSARRAGWDTETTSPDPHTARIVTAAFVVRGAGHPDAAFSWLINPGVPIPDEAAEIHGVTTARAEAEGQDPKTALSEIADRMEAALQYGMPTVAFNTAFDWTVLACELERHGLPTMADRLGTGPLPLVDPHLLDKQFVPRLRGKGQRKLKPTSERYGVTLTDWHTADADALAALLIADAQFGRFPQLQQYGPADLYRAQQQWRAEQQAGLQEWFRTKATPEQGGDPAKQLDKAWPLVPAHEGAAS